MVVSLPKFYFDNKNEYKRGRNLYEGYQRGWGVEFGDLPTQIQNDPLFRQALHASQDLTIIFRNRLYNIFLIITKFLGNIIRPGEQADIIEFGSYKCGNAIFMAYLCSALYPGVKVYALDSFVGMPPTDKSKDLHSEKDFSEATYEEALKAVEKSGLDNIVVVKGLFQDTAPILLGSTIQRVLLAHIDCDIYDAVKYSYEVVKPKMVNGGYYIFDDATTSTCMGAAEAIEELLYHRDRLYAEQIFPHFVFRHTTGSYA